MWERDLRHVERVPNHLFFWKDAWNFEFLLHENFGNAYMYAWKSWECIHENFWECMNAWNFWVCIYWWMKLCVKILSLHILMHEVLFLVMRVHGWMHETLFFLVLLFVWMSSWMNAWESISYFCLNENACINVWDSVFHFWMKMRFILPMHVKMHQTLWNAWELFWSFLDENACTNGSKSMRLYFLFYFFAMLTFRISKKIYAKDDAWMHETHYFHFSFFYFVILFFISFFIILILTLRVNCSLCHHWIHLKFVLESEGCCKSWSYC